MGARSPVRKAFVIQEKDDGGCAETVGFFFFFWFFCCGEGCGGVKMTTNTWIPLPSERGGSMSSSLESAWAYD